MVIRQYRSRFLPPRKPLCARFAVRPTFWLSTVALALLPLLSIGCSNSSISSATDRKQTGAVPSDTVRIGPILTSEQDTLTHIFDVRNTTGDAVRILRVDQSCGCSDASISHRDLAPGESAELTVDVNLPKLDIERAVQVTLVTDHPTARAWPYRLEIRCLPAGRFTQSNINHGSHSVSAEPSEIFAGWFESYTVYGREKPDLVPIPNPFVEVKYRAESTSKIASGIERRRYGVYMELTTLGLTSPGRRTEEIAVSVAGDQCRATVYWDVSSPYRISPQQVHFGVVSESGKPITRCVTLTADENAGRSGNLRDLRAIAVSPELNIRINEIERIAESDGAHVSLVLYPTRITRFPVVGGEVVLVAAGDPSDRITIPWSAFCLSRIDAEN